MFGIGAWTRAAAQCCCSAACHPLPRRCLQATFVALAAAVAVDPTSPLGLALVVGVPTIGIFLVSAFVRCGVGTQQAEVLLCLNICLWAPPRVLQQAGAAPGMHCVRKLASPPPPPNTLHAKAVRCTYHNPRPSH